jgi:hypothetical protein
MECPDGGYPKRKIGISKSGYYTAVLLQMETPKLFFNIPTLADINVGTTDCVTNIQIIFDLF